MIQWQQDFLQDIPTMFKHVHKYNTQFTLTIIQFHSACQSSSMVFLKCTFQSCKLWQASPKKHVSKCAPSMPLTDHGQQRLRDTATRCSVSVRPGIWKGEVLCREWRSTYYTVICKCKLLLECLSKTLTASQSGSSIAILKKMLL